MTKWGHLVLSWFPFSSKAPSSDSAETRDSYAYRYPMRYNPPLEKSLTIKAVWGHFQLVWRNKNNLQGFPLIYAGYWLLLILPHLKPLGCNTRKLSSTRFSASYITSLDVRNIIFSRRRWGMVMPTCPLETRLKQEKRRINFIGRNGPNDIALPCCARLF